MSHARSKSGILRSEGDIHVFFTAATWSSLHAQYSLYETERLINDHACVQPPLRLLEASLPQMCFDARRIINAHGKEAQVRRQECYTRAALDGPKTTRRLMRLLCTTESIDARRLG